MHFLVEPRFDQQLIRDGFANDKTDEELCGRGKEM